MTDKRWKYNICITVYILGCVCLIVGFGMALGIPTMRAIMSKETPRESQGTIVLIHIKLSD